MTTILFIISGTIIAVGIFITFLSLIMELIECSKDKSNTPNKIKLPNEIEKLFGIFTNNTIVLVEGIISVGKSSLLKRFFQVYGGMFISESCDEKLLKKYLLDPHNSAEEFQDERISRRKETIKRAIKISTQKKGPIFVERSVFFDNVFEKVNFNIGYITENYHRTYTKRYNKFFTKFIRKYKYLLDKKLIKIFYLNSNVDRCMKSWEKRCSNNGRKLENIGKKTEYQKKLDIEHKKRINELKSYGFDTTLMNWTDFGGLKE